jgi:hypothetical protein
LAHPRGARAIPNVTSIERRERGGDGCSAGAERRRHRGEAAEGGEGDATPDLLLKHSYATLVTNVRRQMKHLKHASKTLAKTPETIAKTYTISR